jgi:hypothetical protein
MGEGPVRSPGAFRRAGHPFSTSITVLGVVMKIVLCVELISGWGAERSAEVGRIDRPRQTLEPDAIGLTPEDGKEFKPRGYWKNSARTCQGQNRSAELPPSGIVGGLQERG